MSYGEAREEGRKAGRGNNWSLHCFSLFLFSKGL